MDESICIIDWCGGYKNGGFWCDYFPNENIVKFGGEWSDVPNLIIDRKPTQAECNNHAEKYTAFKFNKKKDKKQ